MLAHRSGLTTCLCQITVWKSYTVGIYRASSMIPACRSAAGQVNKQVAATYLDQRKVSFLCVLLHCSINHLVQERATYSKAGMGVQH
jgi:hypothetical protein